MRKLLDIFNLLVPTACPICRRLGPAPCAACQDDLRPAPAMARPPGVDAVHAVLAYEDAGRELVARLKYRNARVTVAWLAGRMAALVATAGAAASASATGPVWVAWVPTTVERRRDRGFDQAELLARAVARRLGLPCRRVLARSHGPPQTGRSQAERRVGPSLAARGRVPGTVVLVDDVVTTGSTVSAAAAALRAAGADRVVVVAAARTPYRARAGGGRS
ncbi:MAG: ComF family protein [Acidimicrobiales bacterium]